MSAAGLPDQLVSLTGRLGRRLQIALKQPHLPPSGLRAIIPPIKFQISSSAMLFWGEYHAKLSNMYPICIQYVSTNSCGKLQQCNAKTFAKNFCQSNRPEHSTQGLRGSGVRRKMGTRSGISSDRSIESTWSNRWGNEDNEAREIRTGRATRLTSLVEDLKM